MKNKIEYIYSRKRIKVSPENKKKIKKSIMFLVIIVIAFFTAVIIIGAINPIFETLCTNKAKSIATIISNEEATKVMSNYSYEDLIFIEKDSNGNIAMVKSNVITLNEIISDVAVKIQNSFNNLETQDIYINLGSFTGIKLFAGYGPRAKFNIVPIGSIDTNFISELSDAGINQTLHRIYLDVRCKVKILTPFESIEEEIVNQVILAENVIVGTIPDTYYDLEGLESGEAMEVMQ